MILSDSKIFIVQSNFNFPVLFYILIVCRVRHQIRKSLASFQPVSHASRCRPRSQSGPTFSSVGPFFNRQREDDGPGLSAREAVEAKRRCVSTSVAPVMVTYKDQLIQVRDR